MINVINSVSLANTLNTLRGKLNYQGGLVKGLDTEGIIIVGLDDCMPGDAKQIDLLAQRLRKRYGHPIVEACAVMPRRGPRLSEAFAKCVSRGARRILVVPYVFELDAHQLSHLAHALREGARNLQGVRVYIGKPLAFDEALVHLVDKRVRESKEFPDIRELSFVKEQECRNAL